MQASDGGLVVQNTENDRIRFIRHNARQPISRLPHEILLMIFFIILCNAADEHPRSKYWDWDWITVTKVCSHWRVLAVSSSILWRKLNGISDVEKARAFLERSQGCDIEIRSLWRIPVYHDLIKANMSRVRRLDLSLSHCEDGDWDLIEDWICESGPLLRLKELCLNDTSYLEFNRPLDKVANWVPISQLEVLLIARVIIPWNHPAFIGLSSLCISKMVYPGPSVSDLLGILENCRNIRELLLYETGLHDSEEEETKRHSRISLPFLQKIDITETDFKPYYNLMNCLVLEECNTIDCDIECRDNPFGDVNSLPIMPESLSSLIPRGRGDSGELHIFLLRIEVVVRLTWNLDTYDSRPSHKSRIEISFKITDELETIITTAAAFLRQDYILCTPIANFTLYGDRIPQSLWWNIFELLPNLRRLQIVDYKQAELGKSFERLVLALAHTPQSIDNNEGSSCCPFYCPCLEEIVIEYVNFENFSLMAVWNLLLDHLKIRDEHGKRLRKLSLVSCKGIEGILARVLEVVDELSFAR